MKKVSGLSVLVMLLFFLTFAGSGLIEARAPDGDHVHNLDTGLSYATIQEAIDASETLNGHTIHVDAGTYNENLAVNKQVSIIGDGPEVTIINAANSTKHAVNITSSNVEISGFKVGGAIQWFPSACGVYLDSVSNVTLLNNYVTNNTFGISLSSSNNITLMGNTVSLNYFGINLEQNNHNNTILRNNSSSNDAYGIVIWAGSDSNLVTQNIFSNNHRGVTLGFSDFNVVSHNNVSSNSWGIDIQETSSSNAIYHNNIVNNYKQAYSISGAVNTWDDGYLSGGNYWSNYTGSDSNYGVFQNETGWDGIGDTAHMIDANNTDHYPLMAPISIFDDCMWDGNPYSIDVVSNSTISSFQLNAPQKTISFSVIGETGFGFCRVTVPNIIVRDVWQSNYIVLVNDQSVEFRDWTGVENTYICFSYQHSTRNVVIVPEFSAVLILPLLFVFAFVVVALQKRKQLGFS